MSGTNISITTKSDITIGTTSIVNGTNTRLLFQSGGVVSQSSKFTFDPTTNDINLADTFKKTGSNFSVSIGASDIISTSSSGANLLINTSYQISHLAGNNHGFYDVSSNLIMLIDAVNRRVGIGAAPSSSVRLDVRAQGALSTDLAFRIRNSVDTDNILSVKGNHSIFLLGETSNARLELTRTGQTVTLLKQRVDAQANPRFVIGSDCQGGDSGQIQFDALFGTGNSVGFTVQRLISGITDLTGSALYGSFGGANATVFVMKNSVGFNGLGTIPTALPLDHFGMYSADIVAGNAAPHFRTENGAILKLYQETTAIAGAAFVSGGAGSNIKTDDTFGGYTLQQIAAALKNIGILA